MDDHKMRFVDYIWAGVLFFLAMLAASCSKETTMTTKELALHDLAQAKAKWIKADVKQYRMDQTVSCFCYFENPEANTWSINETIGGEILINDEPNIRSYPFAKTVNQLFGAIEEYINREPYPHTLSIQYNSLIGFPESLYVDLEQMMADEEIGWEQKNFKVLK